MINEACCSVQEDDDNDCGIICLPWLVFYIKLYHQNNCFFLCQTRFYEKQLKVAIFLNGAYLF